MKRRAKVVVSFLAFVLLAMPTMICLLPATAMSAAEHACCKKMAGECGMAGMAKVHPCCQTASSISNVDLKLTNKTVLAHSLAIVAIQPLSALATPAAGLPILPIERPAFHGPPGPMNSVLRI